MENSGRAATGTPRIAACYCASIMFPRVGGLDDSQHRPTAIPSRTRLGGSDMAARRALAAAPNAGDWLPEFGSRPSELRPLRPRLFGGPCRSRVRLWPK